MIPDRIFVCFSQQKLTELGMLFLCSSRQAEDPSCPETSTPTSCFWSSKSKRCGSSQKVRVEVHTGGSVTDNWINFLFGKYASTCELN
ncbi:hypothetical protein H5410_010759 [Solanum commersonii]|uniref:Uncharacterized protein n=1 Tax=Solanum commersonii TaxID=4109 RepID=A0A9J6ALL9_SOLCO|nr:hypothetical protein H5410_010759 [Solanum commersonii]